MTPRELLEEVKARFVVLYHNDSVALTRLLRQALGQFQMRSGVIRHMVTSDAICILPDDCLSIAICHDKERRYIPYDCVEDADNHEDKGNRFHGKPQKTLQLFTGCNHKSPYIINYFLHMRDWGIDKHLPEESIALVADYLEALIAVPNTERQRNAMLSTNMPVQDLQSIAELKARITELEGMMEERRAVAPPVAAY